MVQNCIWESKPFFSSVKRMSKHVAPVSSAKLCISKSLCEFQFQVNLYTLGTFSDNNWTWPPLWLKTMLQTEQKLSKSQRLLGPDAHWNIPWEKLHITLKVIKKVLFTLTILQYIFLLCWVHIKYQSLQYPELLTGVIKDRKDGLIWAVSSKFSVCIDTAHIQHTLLQQTARIILRIWQMKAWWFSLTTKMFSFRFDPCTVLWQLSA